jgi:three-Cys-motif partner protein
MTSKITHEFGGSWTHEKLNVLRGYLHAYTTALKDQPSVKRPFKKGYIDAFAGTPYRTDRKTVVDDSTQSLFSELADEEPQALLDSSARIALETDPRFDRYIFIERKKERCTQLEELKKQFPALAKDIRIHHGDANKEVLEICESDWSSHRAVLFLDPYGMQVNWKTIEAIAKTAAIDLWLLFPLGVAVNRLLKRDGEIPDGWRNRLDVLLGTDRWFDAFYRRKPRAGLFDDEADQVEKASVETIGGFFVDRLRTIFPGVARPGILRNKTRNPLYLLCFAAANEKGAPIAKRIAGHLLEGLR